MIEPLGPTAFLGALLPPRQNRPRFAGSRRLSFKLTLSFALLAVPTLLCSTVSFSIVGPHLGKDGEVHWAALNPAFTGDSEQFVQWIKLGQDGPTMTRIEVPKITEGQASLLGQLADGRTWWRVTCSHDDSPRTSACASWILVGTDGQPQGRLPYRETYKSHLPELLSDGTLLMTEVGRSGKDMLLAVYRGTPWPLGRFNETPLPSSSEEQPPSTSVGGERVPWQMVWEARFPARVPMNSRENWALRNGIFVSVTADQKQAYVDAYELRGDGPHRELDVLYERTFPLANSGLSTDENGMFALAHPNAVSLSSTGELALGKWAINADCSIDRPSGFVILGPRGNVISDVRSSPEMGRITGLVFDSRDQLVVSSRDIKVYDTGGHLLRESPRLPALWTEQRDEFLRKIQQLNANSSLADWALLYGVIDSYTNWEDLDPDQDTIEVVRRRLIEDWPAIDGFLPDATWIEFARDLCAEHPASAPASGLARFQESQGWEKTEWLRILPHCFPHPPASVQTYLDTMLTSKDKTRRRRAQKLLNAWTPNEEHLFKLWSQLETARSSQGSQSSRRVGELRKELLQLLPANRRAFEERATVSPEAHLVASRVLLSSLGSWPVDYFPEEWLEARTALLDIATEWKTSKDPSRAEIGGLLLLGHSGPDALLLNEGPPTLLLQKILATGTRWPWAALAVARAIKSARPYELVWNEPRTYPSPESVGLPTPDVELLLSKLLTRKGSGAANSGNVVLDELDNALEDSQMVIARSLGEAGRTTLFNHTFSQQSAASQTGRWAHNQLGTKVAEWMTEDLDPWSEEQIQTVLLGLEAQPYGGVLTSPHLLAAVVERFQPDHPLHERARKQFRKLIQASAAYASDPASRVPPRIEMALPFALEKMSDPGRENGPSSLLSEIKPEILRTILSTTRKAHGETLESWINVMSEVGPWPSVLPYLHRMLDGNYRAVAAVILSTQQDQEALQVLLSQSFSYRPSVAQRARAIARYGITGIGGFLDLRLAELTELQRSAPSGAGSGSADLTFLARDHLQVLIKMLADNPAIKQAEELTPALDALANLVQSRLQSNPKARRETVKTLELLLETLGRTSN